MVDLIQLCNREKRESILLSLDFEKAFDSVEFLYINELLVNMNFGTSFIATMQTIYNHSVASVRVNDQTSAKFEINRGTRQGCPLPPYYLPCQLNL